MSTVKVRIAVAVNSKGEWAACGSDLGRPETDAMRAREGVGNYASAPKDAIVHFVTAELPIPTPTEVPGEVDG